MPTFLFILILLMAAGAVYALARGVIGMAQGKDLTGQRSQELMRKRVMYQALAIVFIILFLLVASGGRH
jgi:hypothetical protein